MRSSVQETSAARCPRAYKLPGKPLAATISLSLRIHRVDSNSSTQAYDPPSFVRVIGLSTFLLGSLTDLTIGLSPLTSRLVSYTTSSSIWAFTPMHAQLEIYRIWWTWRGCLQDYYRGSNTRFIPPHDLGEDAMDRVDYDEATAFPMMKPNFNVFGTPSRTRSQRGWYHVHEHPKLQQKHTTRLSSQSSRNSAVSAHATGAHLPTELVQLAAAMMSATLDRDNDKRTLMSCALVCRYWATWFLPQIFVQLSVHSRKCALQLQAYDRSPTCQFFRVSRPDVSVQVNRLVELNYIHLIAPTRSEETSLALNGPVPRGWKTIRSIHQALPQSIPRLFSSKITHLKLTDITFQRFADLVHLVCELPDLEFLHCKRVMWNSLPAAIDSILRRRVLEGRDSLKSISMEESSAAWVQAAVHIYTHFLSSSIAFFPNNNLPAIASLAELLNHTNASPTCVRSPDNLQLNGSIIDVQFFSYYQDRSFELG